MMPGARVIVISDTHLGRPEGSAGSPEALRPLWRDADELVVAGDLAELSDARYRVTAARAVCRMQDLCDADGVRLTFISGNHDALLTDVRQVERSNGAVYVTHGDVFHPAISPWSSHAEELAAWNRKALLMLSHRERRSALGRLAAAQFAAMRRAGLPDPAGPRRVVEPETKAWLGNRGIDLTPEIVQQVRRAAVAMWCWNSLPKRAASFMAEHAPTARCLVFGHMHRAGTWRLGDRLIVNTGSYGFPGKPRAVRIVEGERLEVWPVIRSAGGTCCFGNRPSATLELDDLPEAAAAPIDAAGPPVPPASGAEPGGEDAPGIDVPASVASAPADDAAATARPGGAGRSIEAA